MHRLILLFILSFLSQGVVANSKYNLQSQNNLVATVYGERTIHTRWFGQNRTTSYYDNSVAFTGRYHDKETGLYYFRARYYDSEQGRFISRDPAGYVDGMGLYNGYFASGFMMDPTGKNLFRVLFKIIKKVFKRSPKSKTCPTKTKTKPETKGSKKLKSLPEGKPITKVIQEIRKLPDGAKLTNKQIIELSKNVNLLLTKTGKNISRHPELKKLFKNDPRFRFLDQIPNAQKHIDKVLGK